MVTAVVRAAVVIWHNLPDSMYGGGICGIGSGSGGNSVCVGSYLSHHHHRYHYHQHNQLHHHLLHTAFT